MHTTHATALRRDATCIVAECMVSVQARRAKAEAGSGAKVAPQRMHPANMPASRPAMQSGTKRSKWDQGR